MNKFVLTQGHDHIITWDDVPSDMQEALGYCSHQGQCDADVQVFVEAFGDRLEYDWEKVKAYLRPYGAWDESDLSDTQANLKRLIWLIAGDLSKRGEAYLSAY